MRCVLTIADFNFDPWITLSSDAMAPKQLLQQQPNLALLQTLSLPKSHYPKSHKHTNNDQTPFNHLPTPKAPHNPTSESSSSAGQSCCHSVHNSTWRSAVVTRKAREREKNLWFMCTVAVGGSHCQGSHLLCFHSPCAQSCSWSEWSSFISIIVACCCSSRYPFSILYWYIDRYRGMLNRHMFLLNRPIQEYSNYDECG